MLLPLCGQSLVQRSISTSPVCRHVIKLTRLRVVDNSEIGKTAMLEGKPPKCIHVYNKKGIGKVGDKVLVAIVGEKKKAIIVGCKQKQNPFIPRFDSNNIVLVDDFGKLHMTCLQNTWKVDVWNLRVTYSFT